MGMYYSIKVIKMRDVDCRIMKLASLARKLCNEVKASSTGYSCSLLFILENLQCDQFLYSHNKTAYFVLILLGEDRC